MKKLVVNRIMKKLVVNRIMKKNLFRLSPYR